MNLRNPIILIVVVIIILALKDLIVSRIRGPRVTTIERKVERKKEGDEQ